MADTGSVSVGLVSNIIKTSTSLDESHLEDSLQRVDKKCSDIKSEICEFLRETYDEFLPYMDSTITLDERVRELATEFKRLTVRVENDLRGRILQFSGKKKEIEQRVKEMEEKVNFVHSLLVVHQNMEALRQKMEEEDYTSAATLMTKVSSLLKQVSQSGCDAKVFLALKSEFNILTSNLRMQLQDEWTKVVRWDPAIPVGEQNKASALKFKLCLPDGTSPSDQFRGISLAMSSVFTSQEMTERVKRLGMRLLEAFIKPIILHQSLKLSLCSRNNTTTIALVQEARGSPFPVEGLLADLSQLLTAVQKSLSVEEQEHWIQQLGETIEPEVTPLLIKHLLSEEVTKCQGDPIRLTVARTAVSKYEGSLKAAGFVQESYSVLSDYVRDVDKHVAAQKAQHLLAKTRDILKRPLHNTVPVGPEVTPAALEKLNIFQQPNTSADDMTSQVTRLPELEVMQLSFAFPSCCISESTKEFVDLFYNTLKTCGSSSPAAAAQLYYIARNMIELFMAVVVGYHKPAASELPRNAAVLHNDCMYVSHHLITLGHQFHVVIPVKGGTFIDFVPQLRRLADGCFGAEMEKQTANIREFLAAFGSLEDVSSTEKREVVYRSVRQAMLLIYNLCRVYSDVLPTGFYRRCAGGLLEVLVVELIDCTIKMEDIAATDASEIYNLFETEVILKSSPALSLPLKEEEEEDALLSSLCPSWERLRELSFILNASQPEIVERWDKGEGPLAKQFSAVEVKHLIRAIFRNTDRRADTLMKIC